MKRPVCDFVVEGVTLQDPGPLGSVTIHFVPGVDVLYGLNGSGKSRILRSLLNTVGVDDGAGGGVVHVARGSVLREMDDNDLQQDEPDLPLRGWWKRNLFLNTMQAGGLDNMPSPCKWAHDPDLDWFTFFMASAVWKRFVHFGLDPDRAARVAFATVSQGHVGLSYGGELLASVRIDDADAQDQTFLIALEAAMREHDEEDISSLDREIGLVLEAVRWFDVTGVETEDLLRDPWAPVPLFTTGIYIGSGRSELGLLSVVSELGDPIDLDRESASSLLAFVHDETSAKVAKTGKLWRTPTMDTVGAIETSGRVWLDRVPELANRMFSNLLTDAPHLRLDVRPPHDWFQGRPPLRWWVQDQSGTPVDLQDLSSAQKRWGTLAIRLALDSIKYAHSLLASLFHAHTPTA